jgi:thiol:disulfide interchange protein DsbD
MLQWLTASGVRRTDLLARITMAFGAAALAASSPSTAAGGAASEPAHVRLEVFTDHRSIGPGESFRVAIVQHIDRGWHTYWVNPGDAGLATQIDWTVPQGYSVGAAEWPVPAVFRAGPLVSYGYAAEVIAVQEMRAPAAFGAGTGNLSVDVKWLVCHESCIPGRATAHIALEETPATAGAVDPAAMRRINAAWRKLPRDAPWPASLRADATNVELVIHGAGSELGARTPVRFLPLQWGQIDNAAEQVAAWTAGDLVLTLRRGDLRDAPIGTVEGLLVTTSARAGSEGRGYRLRAAATDPPTPH